jgi:hypothetical protein
VFVSVTTYQARTGEEDAIIALHEDWGRRRGSSVAHHFSCELLRSIADPRNFITLVHYASKETAQAVIDDFKQDALYSRLVSLIEGDLHCNDYVLEWQVR